MIIFRNDDAEYNQFELAPTSLYRWARLAATRELLCSISLPKICRPHPFYSSALGLLAVLMRSDVAVPESIARFLSLYLLMSIGFRGGAEVAHAGPNALLFAAIGAGVLLSAGLPFLAFVGLRLIPSVSPLEAAAITKVLIAFLIAFFPIVISTVMGLSAIEPEKIFLARSMGLSKFDIFRLIRLPNALPAIFGGLKISITLAVVGAVVGEFVGGDAGVGYQLMFANGNMNTPLLFAGIVAPTVLGLVLLAAVE